MAAVCLETLPDIAKLDLKILATDISTRVLAEAEKGTYFYKRLSGNVDEKRLRRHFTFNPEHHSFTVKDDLRKLVSIRELNLLGNYPFNRKFDVVFLRNVLIYFEVKEKETAIAKIAETIKPGGYLVLGLSESLVGVRHGLESMRNSIYRAPGGK
jgi:chemotaxis protein methyltransferase CheR